MHEDRRVNMMDGCPLIYIPSKYGFSETNVVAIDPFFIDPGTAFLPDRGPEHKAWEVDRVIPIFNSEHSRKRYLFTK